jgi:predicted DNA-binding transcriptional regulator YafY
VGWIVVLLILVIILVIWLSRKKEPAQRSSPRPTITEAPHRAASRQSEIRKLLRFAHMRKLRLTIKYETGNPMPGEPAMKVRDIDIYGLGSEYFDAYCHYRCAQRTFRISRVLRAQISGQVYQVPPDYVPSSWVTEGRGEFRDTR